MCDSKQQMRRQALAARRALADRASRSQSVLANATALPEFGTARTILIYVDARSEVRTRTLIAESLADGRTIAVPWCRDGKRLGLFHLRALDELVPGRFGILEPESGLRDHPSRTIGPASLDLALLPGVAFDRRGGRLGHGRGYFDRLLAELRPDAVRVGLAFECQLVEEVPMGPHDVRLDAIVTERTVYRAKTG